MTGGRLDARLLLVGGTAWLGSALARATLLGIDELTERVRLAGRLTVVLAAVAVLVLAAVGVSLVRHRTDPRHDAAARTATVCLLTAVLGATSAALGVVTASPGPVAAWADAGATATISGVVNGTPQVVDGGPAWREPQVLVRVATARIAARGGAVDVDLPVVLRLPLGSAPPPGSQVVVLGRLGAAVPATDAAVALSVDRWVPTASPGVLDASADAMRAGLTAALAGVPPEPASLVAGLAIGDDSTAPPELTEAMQASGLAHLTAVSGGNIAILLAVVVGACRLGRASLRVRTAACVVALGFFTVLVGPQPSVLRAVAMGVIATIGVLVGGRRGSLAVLGTGVLVLVVLEPWLSTSWGFALSALATAGIVLLSPVLAERLARGRWTRRWPTAVREAVALTGAAQLGTLPVLVAMGGAVGWVALPANLLAMPAVVPVTVLGLAAAIVSPVLPAVAAIAVQVAQWPAAVIVAIAHAGQDAPASGLPWPTGWAGVLALTGTVGGLVGAALLGRRLGVRPPGRPLRVALGLAALGAATVLVLLPPGRHGWPPPQWLVLACDVGQGDAILLRSGDGAAVVVDTGPDPDAVDRCLSDAGIDTVPAVVLTHFHADHVGGLAGVLRGRSVGHVFVTPVRDPADGAAEVDRILAGVGQRAEPIAAGDRRQVGAVSWEAIWPRRRIDGGSVANNASIVLVADVGGRQVLLTGDIEAEAQEAIRAELSGRQFDVVKVPHHGSADLAPGFAEATAASVALVSVGADNDYGHPSAAAITAWEQVGAQVLRTDLSGDLAVVAAGEGVGVVTRR